MKKYTAEVLGRSFTYIPVHDQHVFSVNEGINPDTVLKEASNILAGILEKKTEFAVESNFEYVIILLLGQVQALIDSVDIREVSHD